MGEDEKGKTLYSFDLFGLLSNLFGEILDAVL